MLCVVHTYGNFRIFGGEIYNLPVGVLFNFPAHSENIVFFVHHFLYGGRKIFYMGKKKISEKVESISEKKISENPGTHTHKHSIKLFHRNFAFLLMLLDSRRLTPLFGVAFFIWGLFSTFWAREKNVFRTREADDLLPMYGERRPDHGCCIGDDDHCTARRPLFCYYYHYDAPRYHSLLCLVVATSTAWSLCRPTPTPPAVHISHDLRPPPLLSSIIYHSHLLADWPKSLWATHRVGFLLCFLICGR